MIKLLRKLFAFLFKPEPAVVDRPLTIEEILIKHADVIPVELLHALAYSESRMNSDYEIEKQIDVETRRLPSGVKDSYWGLFQVGVTNVLADYNQRHGTKVKPTDLFDPDVNTALAVDTLERIVKSYDGWANEHDIPELETDWDSEEFVRLVIAGWNSGYSRGGGVQKVALWLRRKNIPVTHDNVFKHAADAGATKYLDGAQYDKKRVWQRKVVDRYLNLKKWRSL